MFLWAYKLFLEFDNCLERSREFGVMICKWVENVFGKYRQLPETCLWFLSLLLVRSCGSAERKQVRLHGKILLMHKEPFPSLQHNCPKIMQCTVDNVVMFYILLLRSSRQGGAIIHSKWFIVDGTEHYFVLLEHYLLGWH